MKLFKYILLFFLLAFLSCQNTYAQSDTTEINQSGYFLTFVKKVYLNPTVYLRTQDFKENTNLSFVALPDLSSDKTNASSGFEKGLQKVLRFLMQSDGGVRFYFNPDSTTHPFRFWYSDNLHCKFKQADKDSIDYYLNHNFADGNISMTNALRFETTIDNALDYIEKCLTANPQACGEEPQNETTEINTKPLSVSLHNRVNSKYDIDVKQYEKLESNYAKAFDIHTQQDWYAPAKLLVANETAEPVALAIHSNEGDFLKQNIKIEILKTHALIPIDQASTEDSLFFSLPSSLPAGDPVEVIVKYKSPKDSNTYTVGFFMVNVMERINKQLVIFNAKNEAIDASLISSIQTELDDVYLKTGVKFNVCSESILFPQDFPQSIQVENSGLFSTYMPDMRDYVNEIYDLANYNSDNYYLIIGLKSSDSTLKGYMPRAKNVGFIFANSNEIANTISHELGHGVFHFRHIFSEEELNENFKGSTQNLMDYKLENSSNELTDLYVHQWNYIKNPAFVSWFEDDENSNSVTIGLTSEIFKMFKNTDGTLTLLSPSGKPITIPKETSEIRFSLPDDKWYYNYEDYSVQAESAYTPVGCLIGFTVNGTYYSAPVSVSGEFSGYKYTNEQGKEKYYKELRSKNLQNFTPIIAVPIFDNEGFKISICKTKFSKTDFTYLNTDTNSASGLIDDFYAFFKYTTKDFIKNGYITNISSITTIQFTQESINFIKELLITPSPHEIQTPLQVVTGNIFESSDFYCAGLDATTLFIAAMNYQNLRSYGECLTDLNQLLTKSTFQQTLYQIDNDQNKGFYDRIENDPIVKYSDRLRPKLPDLSQRLLFFDQEDYASFVNQRLKMIFLSLRKFNAFAEKFIPNADVVEKVIVENDIAILISLYDLVKEQQGEGVADCLLQMLSANTKLEILKKHKEWKILDDKEEMITKVLSLASMEDFEIIYPELMKDNYALLLSLEEDLWASEYDLFSNSLAVQFYYHHVYNNTLDIDNLPIFPLHKPNFAPGVFDQYSEGVFDENGVDLFTYIFGFNNDKELLNKSPDKMYRFVLEEDFSFPGWNGKKLREGDTIIAPIYWAYYLVDEENDKINWGIVTKTVEVLLIVASVGTLAPEIVVIESIMAGADFLINVAADYAPHNSDIRDVQQSFQVLYAVYGVAALSNLAINVNWISALQKGGRILYTLRPNNFVPMLKQIKSFSASKVDDLILKLDEAIEALIIAKSNLNMVQGAKVNSFLNYLIQCRKLAKFSKYHNATINYGNFYIEGGELFFKFTQSIHGVNKGYSIRVAKIWDDFDNGLYLSDLNIYNAANDGTVLLDDIIELSSIKLRRPNGTFADVEYRVVITSQGKVRMISKYNLDNLITSSTNLIAKIENQNLTSLISKINALDESSRIMFIDQFSNLSNSNLTRMNNFPNSIDIWKSHTETGRLSLAQNFDVWMKHLEAREYLKIGNYNEVGQIFNTPIITNLSGYVDNEMSLLQINSCNQIINSTTDIQLISINTGISQDILTQVKHHYWKKIHLVKTEDGLILGRFGKDDFDIEIWIEAQNGFQNTNLTEFKKLIAHEYIESKLMELGMHYRSLNSAFELNPYNLGAHDVSPLLSNGSFYNPGHSSVFSPIASDLSNLDVIVNEIKTLYKL